ncbi:uncharacterized protein LOC121837635 [Ixodes scapularis]|uniref:uncharacterized protein LOC121837635 n=1 Tax=Ixodes scapularis TaxID=6945 RepID=UPI001C3958F5|nr:uncharacterized protein LOC121837635 [Ixodes scapularis]
MFKLKFFILFVLAVVCFGSENGEGEGNSSAPAKVHRPLGSDLPGFIGSLEDRKQYVIKLLGGCGGQHQEYKINEKQIWFHNCTYICMKRNNELTSEVRRIPDDMICNKDKMKCPSEGNCPLPYC